MGRTPNDDRSDSMNPNNDAYHDSMDNHSDQLNPNNDEYQGSDNDDDDKTQCLSQAELFYFAIEGVAWQWYRDKAYKSHALLALICSRQAMLIF